MREFGYPVFDEKGVMQLCDDQSDMLMNISVYRLEYDRGITFYLPDAEMAIVLIEGYVELSWNHEGFERGWQQVRRDSCINDPAWCLHVPRNTRVNVIGMGQELAEILVQSTENKEKFEPKFYTPSNTRRETFGQGQFEGKAVRTVTTLFDYASAPYSNMVCGEILIPQGGWSSYPPHEHPQPEVYYYRFGHPAGFGACFIDDNAYVIKDRSFAAIPGRKYHPQVNAPGYAMMYVWMIRHFDGYPWTERNFDPRHEWLLEG